MIGLLWWWMAAGAQELLVKININSQQIEGSDKSVFDNLKQTLEQWMNDRQWTDLQFQKNERINVNFNITVVKRDKTNNRFTCTALIQANRPVFNSSYTTTLYNNKDEDFNFDFAQFDQLNYNDEVVDNQLTALMAYYAYLIIGLDLDSFSPLGGTEILQRCMQLTTYADNLGFTGWKAFELPGRGDEAVPAAAVRLLPDGTGRDGDECGARADEYHHSAGASEKGT